MPKSFLIRKKSLPMGFDHQVRGHAAKRKASSPENTHLSFADKQKNSSDVIINFSNDHDHHDDSKHWLPSNGAWCKDERNNNDVCLLYGTKIEESGNRMKATNTCIASDQSKERSGAIAEILSNGVEIAEYNGNASSLLKFEYSAKPNIHASSSSLVFGSDSALEVDMKAVTAVTLGIDLSSTSSSLSATQSSSSADASSSASSLNQLQPTAVSLPSYQTISAAKSAKSLLCTSSSSDALSSTFPSESKKASPISSSLMNLSAIDSSKVLTSTFTSAASPLDNSVASHERLSTSQISVSLAAGLASPSSTSSSSLFSKSTRVSLSSIVISPTSTSPSQKLRRTEDDKEQSDVGRGRQIWSPVADLEVSSNSVRWVQSSPLAGFSNTSSIPARGVEPSVLARLANSVAQSITSRSTHSKAMLHQRQQQQQQHQQNERGYFKDYRMNPYEFFSRLHSRNISQLHPTSICDTFPFPLVPPNEAAAGPLLSFLRYGQIDQIPHERFFQMTKMRSESFADPSRYSNLSMLVPPTASPQFSCLGSTGPPGMFLPSPLSPEARCRSAGESSPGSSGSDGMGHNFKGKSDAEENNSDLETKSVGAPVRRRQLSTSSSTSSRKYNGFQEGVTVGYTYDAFFISDGRARRRTSVAEQGKTELVPPPPPSVQPQRYKCSECGKHYATSSNLSRHKQTHRSLESQQAKPCPHCGKVYVSMPALSMHILTHDLKYRCNVCSKAFSRPWLLQGHLRSHSGEKPYGCTHCGRAFADRSNLRAHMQTHSAYKLYTCQRCCKSFALKAYLNKHLESSCVKDDTEDSCGSGAESVCGSGSESVWSV